MKQIVSILVLLLGASSASAQSFQRADYATGGAPQAVTIADFNDDGSPDIAVANCVAQGTVSILLNKGDGTFNPKTDFGTGPNPCSLTVGDFNGDGIPDLAVGNGDGTVSILLGNGDGSFGPKTDFVAGGSASFVIAADFNEDGILDLAVVNKFSNSVSILLGNGDGTFGDPRSFVTGRRPTAAATGDFNRDGHLDLAVTNSIDNTLSILLGDGNGNFGLRHDFATGREPLSVLVADFNGDGIPDVAVANHFDSTVSVLLGVGDGSLSPKRDLRTGLDPFSVTTSDVNFHGVSDLVIANFSSNSISVLLGRGDGNFGGRLDFPTGLHPVSLATADFNGDGKLDLAIVDNGSNAVSVLLNTTVRPLRFTFPQNGTLVGGGNPLVWVSVDGDPVVPEQEVVFEAATAEGRPFVFLARQESSDFGAGSYTTTLDTTNFPPGPLFLRARFVHDSTGPVVQVVVRRLPSPACDVSSIEATLLRFDCSASTDETDVITSYEFDFGDGTTLTSASPVVVHSYVDFGLYDFEMTVVNAGGLSATLFNQLVLQVGDPPRLQNRPTCGCKQMVLHTVNNSVIPDFRRPNQNPPPKFNKAPLGADPDFISNNFEILAVLVDGSDPALCTEGQRVKSTTTPKGLPVLNKRACTAGRDLPVCAVDADCDTHKCDGGTQTGQPCDDDQGKACRDGGGQCTISNKDGKCSAFPFAGMDRGQDDYRKPYPKDQGVKLHQGGVAWFDAPGASLQKHATIGRDYKYDGDFLSFVSGPAGSCSCHFTVTIDWDDTNKVYRQPTKITLVGDGETSNCIQR